jgi:protoporphyrinogen oxidase
MSVSRRELLGLIAGAPLMATAPGCKRSPRDIPGKLVGPDPSVGHRLRDATVERASGEAKRVKVVIVGAGPSGLSAAWRLERAGFKDFVVLELEPEPGGTSSFGTDGVVPHPWGAHYVPVPTRDNRALTTLLDEMGALEARGADGEPRGKEELLVREPEERVFADGLWHEGLWPQAIATDEDRAELERFQKEIDRWVTWRDGKGRRAFALPLRRSSDDAEVTALDRISAAAWLDERGLSGDLLRWWVEYACRDDYGASLAETSAWAMLFYFCSRVPAPRALSAPFLSWPEGNGRIVRHLASIAGGRLSTGRLVTDVVPSESDVELSVFDTAQGSLAKVVADRVIMALPKFVVPRVLRPFRDQPPEHLRAFDYGVWWVANLHLRRRPKSRGFGMAWDNVIYGGASLGYVVATHQRLEDYGPTVLTYYQPVIEPEPRLARTKLLGLDHTHFVAEILRELEPAHSDIGKVIERVDVVRWGHAMVRPGPGFVWGAARKRAAEPLGRVHFAHSDLSGVGLFEEAQDHGVRAAEEVLRAEGHGFETIL